MSDAHHSHEHDGPHEGPIKTPKQLIVTVVLAFVVPIVLIVLLVTYVASDSKPAAGSSGMSAEAVAQRLQPIGMVEVRDAATASAPQTGEQVFTAVCSACHTSGAAGAPKVGDEAAWAPRIKTGYDALLASALNGKGAMPKQGGGDHSDFEIGRAVVYMANKSGGKLAEPKAPAAATAAATPTPAAAPAATAAPAAPAAPAPAAVPTAAAPAATAGAAPALYTQSCAVCHAAGIAGAPKFGDKAAWAPRLAQGVDGLTASAIKGKGAMPPRGGTAGSDADIKAVVAYMVDAVK